MSCPTAICNETCPAAVSTINIVTNTISLGGVDVVQVNQQVFPSGSNITLPNADVPVDGTFELFKGGQCLTPAVDYTLTDSTVALVVAPETTDVYLAKYLAYRS